MTAPAPAEHRNLDAASRDDPGAGLEPSRRPRRSWAAAGVAVLAALGSGYWLATKDSATATADAPATPISTARVVRESISDTRRFGGTLGYGDAVTVAASGQGVVTRIADQESEVRPGAELYRIDERPVTALQGTVPMYRDLRPGLSGADVEQLEAGLAELGYDGFTVDDEFTSATAAAVRRWQADLGRPQTGVVGRADVVFVTGGSRVDAVHTHVGALVTPGSPVLDLTGPGHVVSVEIDLRHRNLLAVGTAVVVRLPGGDEVPATVTAAAAAPGEGGETVARVRVTLARNVDGSLLGAPADVMVELDERVDVLTVPVNALLALSGGGHGVEVVAGDGTTSVVPVETGLFAGGRVEISGDGIGEGDTVVVAGR